MASNYSKETTMKDGIEYNEYPPPTTLVKAMKRIYAENAMRYGLFRMSHLSIYRKWENEALGDKNEGHGLFHVDNHPMECGSSNNVFIQCFSFPEITPERQIYFSTQCGYDCIIHIRDVLEFFRRIILWFHNHMIGFHLQAGLMKYNRGQNISIDELNSQKWHHNIFQKDASFEPDAEYRLAATECRFRWGRLKYITMRIGDCSDIISISDMPTAVDLEACRLP